MTKNHQTVSDPLEGLALAMLVDRHPCLRCRFALATHGQRDAAFGGPYAPSYCADCAGLEEYPQDWVVYDPSLYDDLSKSVLLRLKYLDMVRGMKERTVWSRLVPPAKARGK